MEGLDSSGKSLFLGLLLVLFSASVFSAPLEVTGSDLGGFEEGQITGGEEIDIFVNFSNKLDRPLEFLMVLKFSSDEVRMAGGEFIPKVGSFNGRFGAGCLPHRRVDSSMYSVFCGVNSGGDNWENNTLTAKPGMNNFSMNISTNVRIKPADYTLSVDLRSWPGTIGGDHGGASNISKDQMNDVNLGDGSVIGVKPEKEGTAVVFPLDDLYVQGPSFEGSLVKAYKVNIFRRDTEMFEINSSGYLNLTYPEALDEASRDVGIFRYSLSQGEWVNVTDSRYSGENKVFANVSHFSTYAMYSSPGQQSRSENQTDEGSEGNDAGSGTGGFPGFGGGSSPPSSGSPDNETGQQNEAGDEGENSSGEEQSPGETGEEDQSSQDEPNQNESTEDPGEAGEASGTEPGSSGSWVQQLSSWLDEQNVTGYASGSSGNIFVGLTALLIALISVLQYSGRVDFIARVRSFSG